MVVKELVKGVSDTVNPKKGSGVIESIVILLIVISVIAMNILDIEIDPIVASSFGMVAGYLFGHNAISKVWSGEERRDDD